MQFLAALVIIATAIPGSPELGGAHAAQAERAAVAMQLAELTVGRRNRVPVADAGPDLAIQEGEGVELMGAGSFDPDGDPISFLWVQVAGTPVALEPNARVANPAFAAPRADGRPLVFELRVADPHGRRAADTVVVKVSSTAALPRHEGEPMHGEVSLARR